MDPQACTGPAVLEPDAVWLPIAALAIGDSPRLGGESPEHVRLLVESDTAFPPIIVQRGTNRVVDGVHRVRAAQLRGADTVQVRFFDGGDAEAFVLAVRSNVEHGMPLSLADRKAAATRILDNCADWSDRALASVVGLSPKTVATLRGIVGGDQVRVGLDGRGRPLDAAAGRARAGEILARNPTASLRTVSSAARVSVATVRDVRDRLHAAPGDPSAQPAGPRPARRPRDPGPKPATVLNGLRDDPSLRFSESGRLLLRLLASAVVEDELREQLIGEIPEHCLGPVADLAVAGAAMWQGFAARLLQRRSASA